MPLYESTKAKERLGLQSSDTSFDTIITNLGTQADSEIKQKIEVINPDFDINDEENPQIVKDASTDRLVAYLYLVKMKYDSYKEFLAKSDNMINLYLGEVKNEKTLYGETY